MKNFIKVLSVSLLMLTPLSVYSAEDVTQGNNPPLNLYQKLTSVKIPGNVGAKARKATLERFKEEQVTTLLRTSTLEWGNFAHELAAVMRLERRPALDDSGFVGCLDKVTLLEDVANRCTDLDAPSDASYMLLLYSMGEAFQKKHANLVKLEKLHTQDPRNIDKCLQFSMAYLAMADAIPTGVVDVSAAYKTLSLGFHEQKGADELKKEKISGLIPPNHFDTTRRLYFQKSAMLHYSIRYLLGEQIDAILDPQYALKDEMRLKFSFIESFLNFIHKQSMDSPMPSTSNLGWALLIQKITQVFFNSDDFKKEGSVQKSQVRGKNKKNLQNGPSKAEHIMTLVNLLWGQADDLFTQGRGLEATYRECGAFFIYAQLYNDETDLGQPFIFGKSNLKQPIIFGNSAPIKDMPNLMKKIDGVKMALDRVARIEGDILGREDLKNVYHHLLCRLCDQMHKEEFAEVTLMQKFRYYEFFRQNIQSIGHSIAELNKQTFDYITMMIYQNTARVAPDSLTEQGYLQLAIQLLPEIQEDTSIFDYYMDLCGSERDLPGVSGVKKKQMATQTLEERSLIRTYFHLNLLCTAGYVEKAVSIMENSQRIFAAKASEARREKAKGLTREQIVSGIQAEKEARIELQEQMDKQRKALEERRAQREANHSALKEDLPYWYNLSPQAVPSSKAEVLAELTKREEKASQKAALKAEKSMTVKSEPESAPDSGKENVEETPAKDIPSNILLALNKHRETFKALFSRHEGGGAAYNNTVSVDRNAFLKMIVDLGGKQLTSQGNGSHQFVRLILAEQLLDMEVLDSELDLSLTRAMDQANSYGTMTLSWPKKGRGHNRRFLLPEQVLNARLLLSANGLTPSCLPEEGKVD